MRHLHPRFVVHAQAIGDAIDAGEVANDLNGDSDFVVP
jgi:hypothetical protein